MAYYHLSFGRWCRLSITFCHHVHRLRPSPAQPCTRTHSLSFSKHKDPASGLLFHAPNVPSLRMAAILGVGDTRLTPDEEPWITSMVQSVVQSGHVPDPSMAFTHRPKLCQMTWEPNRHPKHQSIPWYGACLLVTLQALGLTRTFSPISAHSIL